MALIIGSNGNDALSALADGDLLFGLAGDDDLVSAFNRTALFGGNGADRLTTTTSTASTSLHPVAVWAYQFGEGGADDLSATLNAYSDDSIATTFAYLNGGADADDITAFAGIETDGASGSALNLVQGDAGHDAIEATATVLVLPTGRQHAQSENVVFGGQGDDDIAVNALIDDGGSAFSELASNVVDGGDGNDTITALADASFQGDFSSATNTITGGGGDDVVTTTAIIEANGSELASNVVDGGDGNDTLTAVTSTNSNSSFPVGINTLSGGAGDDILRAEHASVARWNWVTTFENALHGGDGNDSLSAEISASAETEAFGTNLLEGGSGDDSLEAIVVADGYTGAGAGNSLRGGAGNDTLVATATVVTLGAPALAENLLEGGVGDDALTATIVGTGSSTLFGGDGRDVLTVFGGLNNTLDGGAGEDTLHGSDKDDALQGGDGDDIVWGRAGNDLVIGGAGNDRLIGSDGDDTLLGGADDDRLAADAGNDVVDAGAGNDWLGAGFGIDSLTGGTGIDAFGFDVSLDQQVNTIEDFDRSADRLNFTEDFGAISDLGLPGLADDIDGVSSIVDGGAGADVVLTLDSGTSIIFRNAGTGAVTGVADLVDDPLAQIVSVADWFWGDPGATPLLQAGPFDFAGSIADAEVLPHEAEYLLAEGTLTFTFTADAVDGRRFLFSKDSRYFDDGGHVGVYIEDGAVVARLQSQTDTHVAETAALITPGTEVDLAVTFGAGGLSVFVDGQQEAFNGYTGGLLGNREPIVLGANQWSSGDLIADRLIDPFDGELTEFALYDTVLV